MPSGVNGGWRWAQVLAVLALIAAFIGGGASATTAACTATGVCVTTSDRPDAVSASSATVTRYVAEDTSLANHSGNKLSLVEFHQTIPSGFTFVKDSQGEFNELILHQNGIDQTSQRVK